MIDDAMMSKGLSTLAAGAAGLDDSAARARGRPSVPAATRSRDSGEAKERRAVLSTDRRVKDELLFAMLFVLAVASMLPSLLWW